MSTTVEVMDKIRRLLVAKEWKADLFGENGYRLPFEEADVIIQVEEIQFGDDPMHPIEVWTPVLFDVPITDALCRYVVTQHFRFGNLKFYFDDNQTIDSSIRRSSKWRSGWSSSPVRVKPTRSKRRSAGSSHGKLHDRATYNH